jgi:phosphate starvation-inducible PhoH-like protein
MTRIIETHLVIDDQDLALKIYGKDEENLKLLEKYFPCKIVARGSNLIISGEEVNVDRVQDIILDIIETRKNRGFITSQEVKNTINIINGNYETSVKGIMSEAIPVPLRKQLIHPKTEGQRRYIKSIKNNTLTICIGPAGTGKTYLAMALAVNYLSREEVDRIVLVRPAIEAGEHLGFLPGDFHDKVAPYLTPLYDALNEMLGFDKVKTFQERGIIEIAPLAYMRGRTLNNSFIVLDEAQNCTSDQMKMFLTRIGFNSKVIVTGDITQVDLPDSKPSGLIEVTKILQKINDIFFIHLDESDVVRHKLVQKIITAYEKYENNRRKRKKRNID